MKRNAVAGIDIGGTNTEVGIVDNRGEILGRTTFPTTDCRESFDSFIERLASELRILAERVGVEPAAIGVGAPAANPGTGMIECAADLPWRGMLPLAEKLAKAIGKNVAVTNDANAATVGEMTYGGARGLRNFIMLTLGTGVGSGIVADGHLLEGYRGMAGELGHTITIAGGRPCGCGRHGCLETYCSAGGVVVTATELLLARKSVKSQLRALAPGRLTAKAIYEAALAGDEVARETFDFTGRILGRAAADFAAFSSPEAIILFGGVANAGEMLLKPMREAFEENLLYIYKGHVDLKQSMLPAADAALLGASAVAWPHTTL